MPNITKLQNKAKADILDIYLLFHKGLKYLKKNQEKKGKPLDILRVIEDVIADDLHQLICDIVFPNNEKDLKQFIKIAEERKYILKSRIEEEDYDEIISVLFSAEDFLSTELNRQGFLEHDDSEFAKIIQSISDEEWGKMGQEWR